MARGPATKTIPRKTSGGISTNYGTGNQNEETPKYIKNLRGELNVALK